MNNTSGMHPISRNVDRQGTGQSVNQNTLHTKSRLNNVASKDTFSTHLLTTEEFKELECQNKKKCDFTIFMA